MKVEKSKQSEKARLGAIGENNVVSKIMEHGWDAFNANVTIKNYKSIDLMCVKKDKQSWKPMVSFVQVKTSTQKNIPIGFTIEDCLNDTLEKNVMGPYVFVYADNSKQPWSFRYFILSRKQFIELARQAHEYYVKGYLREKELNLKAPAGLNLRWLEGLSDEATTRHIAFNNPLQGVSCENKWENIWDE